MKAVAKFRKWFTLGFRRRDALLLAIKYRNL